MISGDNGGGTVNHLHYLHSFLSKDWSEPVFEGREEAHVIMEGIILEFDMPYFGACDTCPCVVLGNIAVLNDKRVTFVCVNSSFLVGGDMAVADGHLPYPRVISPTID